MITDKEFKGHLAEYYIHDLIDKEFDIYKKTLRNVILAINNEKTETDLIVITTVGIFVIENKNFKGYIYDAKDDNNWIQKFNKDHIYSFPSPIIQNKYHIDFLKQALKIDENFFISFIVFDFETKLHLRHTHKNCQIMNIYNILETMKQEFIHKEDILTHEEIDKIYFRLKNISDSSKTLVN